MTEKKITFEEKCAQLPFITLNSKQLCDFELLVNGGFAPLKGFMNKSDYNSCVNNMRLSNGKIWAMPITLCINESQKTELQHSNHVCLKHDTGLPLAIMDISNSESIYQPNIDDECIKVYGSNDKNHPYVKILFEYLDSGFVYNIGLFQDTLSSFYSEPSGGWKWVTNEAISFLNWQINYKESY